MRVSRNRKTRIQTDPRGKIKTGYRGADNLPKKLGHFMLVHPVSNQVIFPELVEAYGEKPDRLIICFGSDILEDVFNDDYNLWTKTNTKRRTCNGDVCTHVLDETIAGARYSAGTQTECVCEVHNLFDTEDKDLKKIACKCDMYLKAYIFNPKTKKILNPLPYLFSCHSVNSADNIYSMLSRIKNIKGMPFELFLNKVTKNNMSFYIWNIVPVLIPENLLEFKMDRLPEAETKQLAEPIDPDNEEDEDESIREADYEVDKETGEEVIKKSDQTITHLSGHVKRIESCTSNKDVDSAFEVMMKLNGLSKEDKEYLLKVTAKQKQFIREVTDRENQSS